VLEAVIAEGATTINIPDTVGYAVPQQFGELIRKIREKVPNSDEFSVAFERQVMRDVAVRGAAVYARNFDVQRFVNPLIPASAYTIPYTSIDPGPDGNVATTADNGGTLTYYDYPAEYRGARFQGVMVADSDPNVVYTDSFRSGDGGLIWEPMAPVTSLFGPGSGVSRIAVDPSDSRIVHAGYVRIEQRGLRQYHAGVVTSVDGGATWTAGFEVFGSDFFGASAVAVITVADTAT